MTASDERPPRRSQLSRRGFLTGLTGLTAAVGAGGLAACDTDPARSEHLDSSAGDSPRIITFDGEHQAGIATASPAALNMVGFNLKDGADRKSLTRLLRLWTEDARRLCHGENPLGSLEPEMTTAPENLTITCGFGEPLFKIIDQPQHKPSWLHKIPQFTQDKLMDRWGQTDLVLQICSDDPLMLAFATRHMIRAGVQYVDTQWTQQGFNNAPGTQKKGETPRNLFGQKDGTVNPRSAADYAKHVWIDDGPRWLRGGSAMVVRRIHMNLDTWEVLDRKSREDSTGRSLETGAPLSSATGDEFETPNYAKANDIGIPLISPHSHMARATAPKDHPEQRILRRPFSYDLPFDPADIPAPTPFQKDMESDDDGGKDKPQALSNSGLIFCCFQKDPDRQFTPIQRRLDESDRLNQWITHIGSAVYAMVPGVSEDGKDGRDTYWGQSLLEG